MTSAECKGRQDGFVKAQNDGIIMQREWIAAIDGRTRHAHRLIDGQLADVDKPFKSELGDIMYPGDPTAAPDNVYNCRCTLGCKVLGFGETKKISENYLENYSSYTPKVKQIDALKSRDSLTSEKKDDIIDKKTDVKKTSVKTEAKAPAVEENTPIGSDRFSEEQKMKLLRTEKINNGIKYETAYIYDADGNIKFKVKGTSDEVKFTSKQINDMKGCVITHNHPSDTLFSSADINMLKNSGAAEMRASTHYGTYVLQQPKKWSKEIGSYADIDKVYNSYLDDYILRYKDKAAQEGKHALYYFQEAEEDATRAFAEKYGMTFRIEK